MYPTTTVALGIGKQIYFTRAAVADREDINLSAIVGHNIPGTTLVKLLAETSTPTAGTTPDGDQQDKNLETPHSTPLASPGPTLFPRSREDQTVTPGNTPTENQSEEAGGNKVPANVIPPSASGPDQNTTMESTPSLVPELEDQESDESPPQMINIVRTRAARARQQEEESRDQKELTEVQDQITSWDEIQTDPLPVKDAATPQAPSEGTGSSSLLTAATTEKKSFIRDQKEDQTLHNLFVQARDNADHPYAIVGGILVKKEKDQLGQLQDLILVPEKHRRLVYQEAHCAPLAGHFGFKKTKAKIGRHFYWPGMCKDLRGWTKACSICQKGNKTKTSKAPLIPLPVIETPWTRMAFDVVGPLPRSKKGYKYILTCMDFGSRFPEAIPLKRVDAITVADAMLEIFSRYGIPAEVLTDNGSCFVAKVTQQLLSALNIKALKISPYHPESNGMLERWHRVLKTILTKSGDHKSWDRLLPLALFACRDAPHTATGLSPFEVLYGWHTRGSTSILKELWATPKKIPLSVVQYLQNVRERVQLAADTACEGDGYQGEESFKNIL